MRPTILTRTVVALIAIVAACNTVVVAGAPAAAYPDKPIRLIVPFPAGGGVDAVARVVSQKFSEVTGQQMVIDNRGGSSGIIATYCGLTVDAGTRVLDVFGEPIAGLFAAGELTGGFHGVSYMTGSSLGKCVIFGRIAGRNAARD